MSAVSLVVVFGLGVLRRLRRLRRWWRGCPSCGGCVLCWGKGPCPRALIRAVGRCWSLWRLIFWIFCVWRRCSLAHCSPCLPLRGLFWRAGRREIQNHMMLCCVAYSSLLPTTKKMDVSVVIWECLFDAKAKNWAENLFQRERPLESDVTVFNSDQYRLVRTKTEHQN